MYNLYVFLELALYWNIMGLLSAHRKLVLDVPCRSPLAIETVAFQR